MREQHTKPTVAISPPRTTPIADYPAPGSERSRPSHAGLINLRGQCADFCGMEDVATTAASEKITARGALVEVVRVADGALRLPHIQVDACVMDRDSRAKSSTRLCGPT